MPTRTFGIVTKGRTLTCLVIAAVLLFTHCSYSQEKKPDGRVLTFKGNKIEMARDNTPAKLNGEKVYADEEIGKKPLIGGKLLKDYLRSRIQNSVERLPDGKYRMYVLNMVVDKKGKIAYYQMDDFFIYGMGIDVPATAKKALEKELCGLLNELSMRPAMLDGKPVDMDLSAKGGFFELGEFTIKDHAIPN